MGGVLFRDASIILHSVTGGEVQEVDDDSSSSSPSSIGDIVTRWTMRMTVNVLPWKPTARFSGISVYKVEPTTTTTSTSTDATTTDATTKDNVWIVDQVDYWDSINIVPNSGGEYDAVDRGIAVSDFLDQLKPSGFQAQSAAPELPYQLLRRGVGYEGKE